MVPESFFSLYLLFYSWSCGFQEHLEISTHLVSLSPVLCPSKLSFTSAAQRTTSLSPLGQKALPWPSQPAELVSSAGTGGPVQPVLIHYPMVTSSAAALLTAPSVPSTHHVVCHSFPPLSWDALDSFILVRALHPCDLGPTIPGTFSLSNHFPGSPVRR